MTQEKFNKIKKEKEYKKVVEMIGEMVKRQENEKAIEYLKEFVNYKKLNK